MTDVPSHGQSGYRHFGCRCEPCTEANTESCRAGQRRRVAQTQANGGVAPVNVHNRATYVNWGCRCWRCSNAQAEWNQKYKKKAQEEKRATR